MAESGYSSGEKHAGNLLCLHCSNPERSCQRSCLERRPGMIRMVIPLLILFVLRWPAESSARRAFLTPEQKTRLSDIHTILISAVALSDKGPMSPEPLLRVVREQFKEVGF